MIVAKGQRETWFDAVRRYAELEGVNVDAAGARFCGAVADGYSERRAAFLALADFGITGAEE